MGSEDLTWGGVPEDTPPPRRRASWVRRDQSAPPVGRDQQPIHIPTPVDPPNWSQTMPENHDPKVFAAHMAGQPHPDNPFTDPEPFVSLPEPAEEDAVEPSSPFVSLEPTRDEEPSGEPAEALLGQEPAPPAVETPADLAGLFAAPDVNDDSTLLPERAQTAAPTPAGEFVAPQAPDKVESDSAQPLSAMFDQAPDEAPSLEVSAPPMEVFKNRAEAMEAHKAHAEQRRAELRQDAGAAEDADHHRELTFRYANAERLRPDVLRVLSLAQAADARAQGILNRFVLTRDKEVDAQQRQAYAEVITPLMRANHVNIGNPADASAIFSMAYDELIGIGPLGPLWRDDDVTEIMVSGPGKVIAERNGVLVPTPAKYADKEHLSKTARDLARKVDDRGLSRANPLVTAQLPGARVQFALAPVAPVAGTAIIIRKFRPLFGLRDLLSFGALDPTMAEFLKQAVEARATVLVSGGTGSGKTTMINALSEFIPDNERVITIEDAQELSLTNTHVETLLTKEASSGDDKVVIGQDALLRASLRMRPDRIIVGEIRDSAGCFTMMQAANTGHDGTMTTVHANDPELAVRRLSQLLQGGSTMTDTVAREEVMMAFDLIVQVVRVRGRRFISHISLVNPVTDDGPATTALFAGKYAAGAPAPVFSMANPLRSDTDLAARMTDVGIDPTIWSTPR